ncbi:MAG: hypothetical protein WC683_10205 [bacterium]
MYGKRMDEVEVGDYIASGWDKYQYIGQVVKITKTQITAKVEGRSQEVRINRQSGKEIGGRSWWHYCDDVEAQRAVNKEVLAAKSMQREAKEAAWAEKLAAVRAANVPFTVVGEGIGDLMKVRFVNKDGDEGIVYFSFKQEKMWLSSEGYEPVDGYRLNQVSVWMPSRWHGGGYEFSSPGRSCDGRTLEDALVDLIASHYWD